MLNITNGNANQKTDVSISYLLDYYYQKKKKKNQKITRVFGCEEVEKLEPLYTLCWNVKWFSCCRKLSGSFCILQNAI